ncbi:Glycosyl hydrolases family 16 [Lutibacter agarilyticus]|uniref:Glycosyl hydrolases family 16 n=1 Tax=Lutibacter agarilyticus TaxID=1109740 RepID=A0A238XZN7_9FLAO|nr:glycoside hydrolase family 16 protein [Lutibacter agarilyticus]SNR64162.1 Glycosyl hydrolases family 16 [Lutibacter agarilyticus]
MNKTIKHNVKDKPLMFMSSLLAVILIISSCSNDETQTVTTFEKLVMADEFDTDGALNNEIWSYDIGNGSDTQAGAGWGNNELQYYTDRSENATVQNGVLIITAREEAYNGSQYTSARIVSKVAQTYGRYEASIRLPYGQGLWPAFWLLGDNCGPAVVWPECGEIDIMEYRGQEPTIVHGTVHGNGYSGGEGITKSYSLINDRFDTGFHVFGIEWAPDYINFYVDDVLYNQITPSDVPGEWAFDHPFNIIINLAVGGNYLGSPNNETVFPQTMLVDYVRVYENQYK